MYPRFIQEQLIKYPETIEEDSSYEDDDHVQHKYSQDPLPYILGKDNRKRDAIEMNGEPTRIWNARTRRGDKNYKCLAQFLEVKAIDVALTKMGLSREMTEERRWGKHIKDHSQLQHDQYRQPVE